MKLIHIVSTALMLFPLQVSAIDASELSSHIKLTISKTVRTTPSDTLGNIGLPFPYSVPCIRNGFQNMFYWDTYFTNLGLLIDGDFQQARNNIVDIAAMVSRFGYMPNATHRDLLNRSQPPYLALMLEDYYKATGDIDFLRQTLPAIEREYDFWMKERITPCGLNSYGHSATSEELVDFYNGLAHRVGENSSVAMSSEERQKKGAHLLAEAESGWDFNPRFERRCMDYCPVDLNSLLYAYESFMQRYGNDKKKWEKRANKRLKLMRELMTDQTTGVMYDYDYVNSRMSPVVSAASWWPIWLGISTNGSEVLLRCLEAPHGMYTCDPTKAKGIYQWDAPNGWSACQYAAYMALDRIGREDDAKRIAKKYVDSIVDIYNATGQLWEKYNVAEGSVNVKNEYPMPGEFMGWTAGVFQHAFKFLNIMK